MNEVNEFFESLFESIRNNGSLAGFVMAGLGGILLVAVVADSDWVLEGGNGRFNIATIGKIFGRTTARVLMGLLSVVIIAAGFLIAFSYPDA